ncbi:hypothetical protein [Enterococcus phage MDA2]|uniref:Uncharacterized protein n=1 Tax=Enterococcus phage MDA2 TaxID=2816459 RepID=A0AAE7RKL7_9CAUD|nr:hypothetical protein [Enterococcus phage MDA2]
MESHLADLILYYMYYYSYYMVWKSCQTMNRSRFFYFFFFAC